MGKIKLIVTGETQVGKTSLLNQFIPNFPNDEISQTFISDKYSKEIIIEGQIFNLEIWDFAGGKRYREVNKLYLTNSNIALLVYDITNINSFNELKYHYRIICEFNENKNIVFGIIANKSDLYEDEVISKETGEEFAKSINAFYFETCTLEHENVVCVFEQLVQNYSQKDIIINLNKNKIEKIMQEKYWDYLIDDGIKNLSEINDEQEEGYIKYENGDLYAGQLSQKKRNGNGIIIYLNENEYEGEWKNDKKEGNGKMKYKNGDEYNGIWKDDTLNNGKMKYINGDFYKGDWNNNKKEGHGEMTYYNRDFYDGDWKNDKRNGRGKMKYNNEDCYDGDWKNNERNGTGKMIYKNGEFYEGDWKNDKRNGKGTIFLKDNKILEGNFTDGKKEGEIKVTIQEIGYLTINFKDDLMDEKGIFYYNNGDKLEGYFNKDYNPIKGKLIYKNGGIYEGKLDNSYKRKGRGIMRYNNGEIYDGEWNNDKKEGEGILCLNNEDYKIIKDIIFYNNNLDNIFNLDLKDSFYKGSFKNDQKDGNGILYMKDKHNLLNNNSIFKGIFKNDQKYNGNLFFKNKSYLNCYWKDENNIDETLIGTFIINNVIEFKNKLNTNDWINLIKKEQLYYLGNSNINIPLENSIK